MKSVRRLSNLYAHALRRSRERITQHRYELLARVGPRPPGFAIHGPARGNSVKFYLTEGQQLRLLCVGAQCNLFTVRSIQLTENAHDTRIPRRTARASAACRDRHGRYCLCRPVCDAGRVACAVTPSDHMNLPFSARTMSIPRPRIRLKGSQRLVYRDEQ
jgi:hypothetical protein